MHTYEMKVISVTVVQSPSTADTVYITFDAPSSKPKKLPSYNPILKLEVQADYGLEYVTKILGIPRTLVTLVPW